jgi:DNA polymerase
VLAAHNGEAFDRFGAERYGFEAADWIDTSWLARRAGLPGALDALGTRWLGIPKDKVASRYTKALSMPKRPTQADAKAGRAEYITAAEWKGLSNAQRRRRGLRAEVTLPVLERVVAYCESDVAIMREGWTMLESWLDVDEDAGRLDRVINDRGVGLDVDLVRRLLDCDRDNGEAVCRQVAAEVGCTAAEVRAVANSPAEFCAITSAANAQAETIAEMISEGRDETGLARARQAIASISAGKLRAGLARVSPDGRLRDMHRYYGAHTGRWSGQGMQLHNLPRPDDRYEKWTDDDICRLADLVVDGKHLATADEIQLLIRGSLVARPGHTFVVCDFSGVEARALAWAARDEAALAVFRSGKDPYKVAAMAVYGIAYDQVGKVQRQVGKVAELACGYGMGAGKFEATAIKACKAKGIDFLSLGVDSADVVHAWRQAHKPSVSLWYQCERAFKRAVAGHSAWAGPFQFVPSSDGRDVAAFLPGGRPIVYNGAGVTSDGERSQCVFVGTKGREHTYGGKLVENLIQAMCRDLLVECGMALAERDGLSPVLHVHDEVVCEVRASEAAEVYDHLRACMSSPPAWAAGFPLGASGFVGRRYRK